jgi:hypothetical protein
MIFSFSRIVIAEKSSNDSAQSPAWRRNARPAATSARAACSCRASPANTSGGIACSFSRASASARSSGQSAWWCAGRLLQEEGDQVEGAVVKAVPV